MDGIKTWVISISSVLIFITAVEMILPDNDIKKYAKFVFGIIIAITVITPLINFIYKGPDEFQRQLNNYIEHDLEQSAQAVPTYTNVPFNQKMEDSIKHILKDKYPDNNFEVKYEGEVSKEDYSVCTNYVEVSVGYKGIKPIKDVELSKDEDYNEEFNEIRDYLAQVLKVDKDKIKIIEMGQ